jgi:hypothetical protein
MRFYAFAWCDFYLNVAPVVTMESCDRDNSARVP